MRLAQWLSIPLLIMAVMGVQPLLSNSGAETEKTPAQAPPFIQKQAASPASAPIVVEDAVKAASLEQEKPLKKQATFQEHVEQWMNEISKQKGFENWEGAAWSSLPIGPGTHGWVVLLTHGEEAVGYMVIHAKEKGSFVLTEYGAGPMPLFSYHTLYQSLMQQELIPAHLTFADWYAARLRDQRYEQRYYTPLEAVWLLTEPTGPKAWDAWSGELYSITDKQLQAAEDNRKKLINDSDLSVVNSTGARLINSIQVPVFDPYASIDWITREPDLMNSSRLQHELKHGRNVILSAELFGGAVMYPFAVVGVHQWADAEYLMIHQLWQEETAIRLIPASYAYQQGKFYVEEPTLLDVE